MANDWIQFYKTRITDARTKWLGQILGVPRMHAVGLLVSYFAWGDGHITDDDTVLDGWVLDDEMECEGFSEAMAHPKVGWIAKIDDTTYHPVDWEKKNSKASRTAANASRRKQHERAQDKDTQRDTESVTPRRDKVSRGTVTRREEKRRDKKREAPLPPKKSPRKSSMKRPAATWEDVAAAIRDHMPAHSGDAEVVQCMEDWYDERSSAHGPPSPRTIAKDLKRLNEYPAGWVIRRLEDAAAAPWKGLTFSDDPKPEDVKHGNGQAGKAVHGQSPQGIGYNPGQTGHMRPI